MVGCWPIPFLNFVVVGGMFPWPSRWRLRNSKFNIGGIAILCINHHFFVAFTKRLPIFCILFLYWGWLDHCVYCNGCVNCLGLIFPELVESDVRQASWCILASCKDGAMWIDDCTCSQSSDRSGNVVVEARPVRNYERLCLTSKYMVRWRLKVIRLGSIGRDLSTRQTGGP